MKDLKNTLPIESIDFKVKKVYSDSFQILAYKDARVDMDILDDVCGQGYWQNEYKRDSKGILQCGIGIYDKELSQWIWKWSNGVPSDFEGEKGEYSDALKRAGFMWGIGRHLYNFPAIIVKAETGEISNGKARVYPNSWKWKVEYNKDQTVKYLGAIHNKKVRFQYGNL